MKKFRPVIALRLTPEDFIRTMGVISAGREVAQNLAENPDATVVLSYDHQNAPAGREPLLGSSRALLRY